MKYKFKYDAGEAQIPSGATVALVTGAGPTPISPTCGTTVNSNPLTLTPGARQASSPINNADVLAPNLDWDCEFTVAVIEDHKVLGKINTFSVQLVFGGTASSKAFHVAALDMPAVYVYTGGVLDISSAVLVDTTGAPGATFHASE